MFYRVYYEKGFKNSYFEVAYYKDITHPILLCFYNKFFCCNHG